MLWRRRARRGLDRITRAPADKRASILPDTDGEPFTLIEPFTAAGPFPRDPGSANASRVDVSERSPLALGASKYAAVRAESPVPTSVYTGLGAMSEAGGGGSGAASEAGSKCVLFFLCFLDRETALTGLVCAQMDTPALAAAGREPAPRLPAAGLRAGDRGVGCCAGFGAAAAAAWVSVWVGGAGRECVWGRCKVIALPGCLWLR